jgi:hypothetical protein
MYDNFLQSTDDLKYIDNTELDEVFGLLLTINTIHNYYVILILTN